MFQIRTEYALKRIEKMITPKNFVSVGDGWFLNTYTNGKYNIEIESESTGLYLWVKQYKIKNVDNGKELIFTSNEKYDKLEQLITDMLSENTLNRLN